ncbi:MAG: hypothetical protein ABEI99_01075 [Halobaculum sp.]
MIGLAPTALGPAIATVVVLFCAVVAALTGGFALLALRRVRQTGEVDPWEELLLAGVGTAAGYAAVRGFLWDYGDDFRGAFYVGAAALALLLLWSLFRVLLAGFDFLTGESASDETG